MKQIFLLVGILLGMLLQAQDKYWVMFADKGQCRHGPVELALSQRALDRRAAHNVSLDEQDRPVNKYYINQVRQTGAQIANRSKWLNAVSVLATPVQFTQLKSLPFVTEVKPVGHMQKTEWPMHSDQLSLVRNTKTTVSTFSYGMSGNQLSLLNGTYFHDMNYRGQGIRIAVLDGGFENADNIPAFDSMWANNRVLATWDFVDGDTNVFHLGGHGTNVLSTIAGLLNGQLIGAAPYAQFLLLKSEDQSKETPIEEDNWVAAAEYADSAGADIISSSLGYNTFDGGIGDYTWDDLDGRTATTTKAAIIAARKGILVVNSAGNEGSGSWQKIITPADADSILAVGGVDAAGSYVQFSSKGPTADGRIKPDIVAQASGVILSRTDGVIGPGNGTSFAAPVISGMAACLWQKYPEASAWEIREAIVQSASLYNNPNNEMGNGIPNFRIADAILSQPDPGFEPDAEVLLMPNPFVDELILYLRSDSYPQQAEITVNDMRGNLVAHEMVEVLYKETDLSKYATRAAGMYVFEVRINGQVHHFKMIR